LLAALDCFSGLVAAKCQILAGPLTCPAQAV
jgi:hypothetical protein